MIIKNERKWSWDIGQQMKMYKKDNDIPLKVFAYDIGYSQQHILMMEKGEAKFNLENLDKISSVMGKTLKIDLVEGKVETFPSHDIFLCCLFHFFL